MILPLFSGVEEKHRSGNSACEEAQQRYPRADGELHRAADAVSAGATASHAGTEHDDDAAEESRYEAFCRRAAELL
jgi:hypothetical protein